MVNPGGPGYSGVELPASRGNSVFTDEILERFDIVGFDPRGVELSDKLVAAFDEFSALVGGASEPEFACGDHGEQIELLTSIDGDVDTPEEIALGEAAANLCIQSMGPVGGLLHTAYVARDMDEIRKALGADQISYLGYSYGSALGVWYATLFPESVRAMVVDGANNPDDARGTPQERMDEIVDTLAPREDLLGRALRACGDPTDCPIYNDGDPIAYFMRAIKKLDLVNRAVNDGRAAEWGVISTLYDEADWPKLWRGLFELNENDDPAILVESASFQLQGKEWGAPSFAGHVNCLDKWVLQPEVDRKTQLEEDFSAIDGMFPLMEALIENAGGLAGLCPFYDQFAPDPFDGPLNGSDAPILVVGNHSDPITSFGESEELATEVLSNGYLLETDHARHAVYPNNRCVNEHVESALSDRVYPSERRVICEREDWAISSAE